MYVQGSISPSARALATEKRESRQTCVCLTIFVSVFSSGADPAFHHLDVLATGATVQLVDSVVSPAHGVPHMCLVLHMHTEVDSIHTKYLLEHPQTHPEVGAEL